MKKPYIQREIIINNFQTMRKYLETIENKIIITSFSQNKNVFEKMCENFMSPITVLIELISGEK